MVQKSKIILISFKKMNLTYNQFIFLCFKQLLFLFSDCIARDKLSCLKEPMTIKLHEHQESATREIVLESTRLKACFLPEIGFKFNSLKEKDNQMEFLFQPHSGRHPIPAYRGRFVDYEASGCDEMLPTIDACHYNGPFYADKAMPDHGGVWSRPWSVHLESQQVHGQIRLLELPLLFEKTISWVDESSLEFAYRVTNEGDAPVDFLWALHPLCVFQNEAKLLLPPVPQMFNVHQYGKREELLPFPYQDSLGKKGWNVCELAQ